MRLRRPGREGNAQADGAMDGIAAQCRADATVAAAWPAAPTAAEAHTKPPTEALAEALWPWQALEPALRRNWWRALQTGEPLALVLGELLDDEQARPAPVQGDAAEVCQAASLTRHLSGFCVQATDTAIAVDGRRFGLLLGQVTPQIAASLAHELRASVSLLRWPPPAAARPPRADGQ